MNLPEQETHPCASYRIIPLTRGKVVLVDPEDYDSLAERKWFAQAGTKTFYAARDEKQGDGSWFRILMHREIMGFPATHVDHRDLDGLNCRRNNLRVATMQLNKANEGLRSTNTSGYKGAYAFRGRWLSSITVAGRQIYLGTYATAEDAGHAYAIAAKNHFGEFARVK